MSVDYSRPKSVGLIAKMDKDKTKAKPPSKPNITSKEAGDLRSHSSLDDNSEKIGESQTIADIRPKSMPDLTQRYEDDRRSKVQQKPQPKPREMDRPDRTPCQFSLHVPYINFHVSNAMTKQLLEMIEYKTFKDRIDSIRNINGVKIFTPNDYHLWKNVFQKEAVMCMFEIKQNGAVESSFFDIEGCHKELLVVTKGVHLMPAKLKVYTNYKAKIDEQKIPIKHCLDENPYEESNRCCAIYYFSSFKERVKSTKNSIPDNLKIHNIVETAVKKYSSITHVQSVCDDAFLEDTVNNRDVGKASNREYNCRSFLTVRNLKSQLVDKAIKQIGDDICDEIARDICKHISEVLMQTIEKDMRQVGAMISDETCIRNFIIQFDYFAVFLETMRDVIYKVYVFVTTFIFSVDINSREWRHDVALEIHIEFTKKTAQMISALENDVQRECNSTRDDLSILISELDQTLLSLSFEVNQEVKEEYDLQKDMSKLINLCQKHGIKFSATKCGELHGNAKEIHVYIDKMTEELTNTFNTYVKYQIKTPVFLKEIPGENREIDVIDYYLESHPPLIPKEEWLYFSQVIRKQNYRLFTKHSNLVSISLCPVQLKGKTVVEEKGILLGCIEKGFIPIGEPLFPKWIGGIPCHVRESFICFRCNCISNKTPGASCDTRESDRIGSMAYFVRNKDIENKTENFGFMTAADVVRDLEILLPEKDNMAHQNYMVANNIPTYQSQLQDNVEDVRCIRFEIRCHGSEPYGLEAAFFEVVDTKECLCENKYRVTVAKERYFPEVSLTGPFSVDFEERVIFNAAYSSDFEIISYTWQRKAPNSMYTTIDIHEEKYTGSSIDKLVINGAKLCDEAEYKLLVENVLGEGKSNVIQLMVKATDKQEMQECISQIISLFEQHSFKFTEIKCGRQNGVKQIHVYVETLTDELQSKSDYICKDIKYLPQLKKIPGKTQERYTASKVSLEERRLLRKRRQNGDEDLFTKHSNLISIGLRFVCSLNESCIVLCCIEKGFIPIGEEMFPERLYGYRCVVREEYVHFGCTCISNITLTSRCHIVENNRIGSFGCYVKSRETSAVGFITAAHVVRDKNLLVHEKDHIQNQDQIVAQTNIPIYHSWRRIPLGRVGRIRFASHQLNGIPVTYGVDAAFVVVLDPETCQGNKRKDLLYHDVRYICRSDEPVTIEEDVLGRQVLKEGCATEITDGIIVDDMCTFRHKKDDSGSFIIFENTFRIESGNNNPSPIFDMGDSGAVAFLKDDGTQTLRPVGLAFAYTENCYYASNIAGVLEALNVDCRLDEHEAMDIDT